MTEQIPDPGPMLKPSEVADLFGVHVKTVYRWAQRGEVRCTRTLGGHRRFYATEIRALLEGDSA